MDSSQRTTEENTVTLDHNPTDIIRNLTKRPHDRLSLETLNIGQSYLHGDLNIAFHYSIRGSDEQFYALFRRDFGEAREQEKHLALGDRVVNLEILGADREGHETPVLLRVVENVEIKDQLVSSIVWLDRIDNEVSKFRIDSLYFSIAELRLKTYQIPAHRQAAIARLDLLELHGVALQNSSHDILKGTSQIAGDILDSIFPLGRYRLEKFNHVNMISRLRLFIDANKVGLSSKEFFDLGIEIRDLAIGPI